MKKWSSTGCNNFCRCNLCNHKRTLNNPASHINSNIVSYVAKTPIKTIIQNQHIRQNGIEKKIIYKKVVYPYYLHPNFQKHNIVIKSESKPIVNKTSVNDLIENEEVNIEVPKQQDLIQKVDEKKLNENTKTSSSELENNEVKKEQSHNKQTNKKSSEVVYDQYKDEELNYEVDEFQNKLNLEKIDMINHFNNEIKKTIDTKAVQMMIEAMERNAENVVSTKFSFTIKLLDEAIKGKIIGKDGRNKKTFENLTGTDLIIESDQKAVTISSPNPIRREIAKKTMEKLLEVKNIDPNKIEKVYEEIKQNFDRDCYEIGKETIENKLKIFDLDENIYEIVGKLHFRTSYTQNVLTHCVECANLASQLAECLGIDKTKAKKAAFFHDIGKAVDYELDNDHVDCGVKIAQEYKLDDYIINAIESHHDKVLADNPYAALVKVVDKLSAARPGARLISNEGYYKRMEVVESICKEFESVQDAYALKSGRQIRVIVNPSMISDTECEILMKELKFKLEENELVNKQPIEIIIYREYSLKSKTQGSAGRMKDDI